MKIKRAIEKDMDGINKLLEQVLKVHHNGRPDLFKKEGKKYNYIELIKILKDDERPVFVAKDKDNKVMGYAFCVFQKQNDNNVLNNIKTLYIDDLCVDEDIRGRNIGKDLYDFVLNYAKEYDCYNLTLNVWSCNEGALRFYEKCGLKPQKVGMEIIL